MISLALRAEVVNLQKHIMRIRRQFDSACEGRTQRLERNLHTTVSGVCYASRCLFDHMYDLQQGVLPIAYAPYQGSFSQL